MEHAVDFFATNIHIDGVRQFSFHLVFAVLGAVIAGGKGRSMIAWFLVCGVTACFGLIVLLCMEDLNEQKAAMEQQSKEARRLRERLRQEQHKNKRFRESVRHRLGAHDRALGMDTSALPHADAEPMAQISGGPEWYYDDQGAPAGPISRSALMALKSAGTVAPDTLVWREGLADWTPYGQVSELA